MMHLRLTVDVYYKENGCPEKELCGLLQDSVFFAVGNGLLTGETSAEVEHYELNVQEVRDA